MTRNSRIASTAVLAVASAMAGAMDFSAVADLLFGKSRSSHRIGRTHAQATTFRLESARRGVTDWPRIEARPKPNEPRREMGPGYFEALREQGYVHVGLVFAPKNWQEGKRQPEDFEAMREKIDAALDAGLQVVVRTQPWSMKSSEMFKRRDVRYFDAWLTSFARMIGGTDPDRVAWEFLSEPGWFTRDTSKLGIGDNNAQRPVGTRFLHDFWAHAVPLIRRHAPRHTLILGLPGWGHSYGANEHLLIETGRYPNVVHGFHFYWPFDFTHDKTGRLDWPEPDWREKLSGRDLKTIAYSSDNQPWSRRGLDFELDKLARWRDQKGVQIYVAECGPVFNRNSTAGKAYQAELEAGLRARGIPYALWLG